jgi:site-specific recombinase XerD
MSTLPVPRPPVQTVADVIRAFLDNAALRHQAGGYALASLKKDRFYLGSFAQRYGRQPLADCRQQDLVAWLAAHPEYRSSHTKQDAAATVVRCFRWAKDEELIERAPYRRPKGLWAPPGPRQAILPRHVWAMLDAAKVPNGCGGRARPGRRAFRVALWFLWQTGCRVCEMRAARFDMIDWARRLVVFPTHKTFHATGLPRLLALGRAYRLVRFLYRWRQPGQTHIFLNSRGRPWTKDFAKTFRTYAQLAGAPDDVSAYSLRHGFTVQGLENGVGERQMADLLGHSGTRFISWYGRQTRTRGLYLARTLARVHGQADPAAQPGTPADEPPPVQAPVPPAAGRPTNRGALVLREAADRYYQEVVPSIIRLRNDGATYQQIAEALNAQGSRTRFGRAWSAGRVHQIIKRRRAKSGRGK